MKTTVSEKGQVTIPKAIRERMGIRPGQVLEMEERRGRIVVRKVTEDDPVSAVYGTLDLGMTTDEFIEELRGKPEIP